MATPAQGSPTEAGAGEVHPVLNVFFSPGAAMDSLARRPRFLVALVILTVIGIASIAIAFQKGTIEQSMRQRLENDPRIEQLSADQKERAMEQATRFGSYSIVGGAVVGPLLGLLVVSGFFMLITNVIGGATVSFRQMIAVVAHGWLPLALSGLISIPILLLKDPETVDIQNVVNMANFSFLFSPTDQHKLYAVASSIDVFSFWVMALLTVGIARLTGKGKGSALVTVLVPWVLYVVVFKALLG